MLNLYLIDSGLPSHLPRLMFSDEGPKSQGEVAELVFHFFVGFDTCWVNLGVLWAVQLLEHIDIHQYSAKAMIILAFNTKTGSVLYKQVNPNLARCFCIFWAQLTKTSFYLNIREYILHNTVQFVQNCKWFKWVSNWVSFLSITGTFSHIVCCLLGKRVPELHKRGWE